MNIYFTSDTHYSHTNIAGPKVSSWKSGYRDFDSVKEMNDAIVDSINTTVKSNDLLYHLGDWSFGGEAEIERFYNRLNCRNQTILIKGNHDKTLWKKYRHLFKETHLFLERYLNNKLFVMSHFSMRVWEKSHHGSFHLYGHSHHTLPEIGKSMDVGWCKYRRPLHIDEVIEILDKRDIIQVDHHNSECAE